MEDFRKYATKHLGMSGTALDSYMNISSSYISPTIIEERQLNVAQMDVFSRLMMDRIIFLGTQVDDYTANVIQAQLLYLDSSDPGRTSLYISIRRVALYMRATAFTTHAVYFQRRIYDLYGYGRLYGVCLIGGGNQGKTFRLEALPCNDPSTAWRRTRTGLRHRDYRSRDLEG